MTWTDITRAEHTRKTGFYPSDLTFHLLEISHRLPAGSLQREF